MATINGTFNSLIAGTLSGTVATPGATGPAGPAGPAGSQGIPGVGVPVGGTAGQVLAKVDGVDYNTEWVDQSAPDFISSVSSPLAVTSGNLTINLAGYATETFVTSQGYITSSALSPYLLSSTAASTYQTIAGMAGYAQLSGATFTGNVFAPTPSPGTDSTQIATTAWVKGFDYAPTNSPTLTGNPKSETPNLADNDTSIATTAFVKGQGYITSSALTGYATESFVTSQGYITSSALSGYALLSGATFTGKVTFTTVGGVAGLNVGVGGTDVGSNTPGDLWIAPSGSGLNYRDGLGAWRILAARNLSNTFTAPQIVSTPAGTTNAALRVTQLGTGNALVVEDSTSPDATAFVVDQHGKVGIGVAPDASAALKVDGNGIMFGDGTTQTTAAVTPPPSYSDNQAIADMITASIINTYSSGTIYYFDFRSNLAFGKYNFGLDVTLNGLSLNSWTNNSSGANGLFEVTFFDSPTSPFVISYKGIPASLPFGNFGT
jgi:hypothetical protein